ncbi:MAG: Xaa-Pro peptidase family protein [Candidatus Micrarchaeota archaeon]
MLKERLRKLQRKLRARKIDLLVLGGRENLNSNVYYYAGDDSYPALLFVTPHEAKLLSTGEKPAEKEIAFEPLKNGRKQFAQALREFKPRSVAVDAESDYAAPAIFRLLKQRFAPKNFAKELEELRLIKDEQEKSAIREAQRLTKRCVSAVLERGVYGRTENAVAGALEAKARELGAALAAFPPIVVSGERTAIPHAAPSNKKIARGDVVVIDVGCRVREYCGDYSHSFYDGSNERKRDALAAAREAQREALRKAKPGVNGKALAEIALHVLRDYGFEAQSFRKAGLGLGHFLGLDVHEGPRLERTTLRRGMVFTVEPGIYERSAARGAGASGAFGCRFEDVVLL